MPRKQMRSLSPQEKEATLNFLWAPLLHLSSPKETRSFLEDVLTDSEKLMLARRIQIASLLLQGYTCDDVIDKTGSGKNTVTSVNKWLQNTSLQKQKRIAKIEKEVREKRVAKEEYLSAPAYPFSLEHLKKRYPLHFLLLTLANDTPPRSRKPTRNKQKKRSKS